jgi:hypothetical protein
MGMGLGAINNMNALKTITYNFLVIVLMIALIPIIENDYFLLGIYLLITLITLFIKFDLKDVKVFFLGLIMLTISESIFVSTGVETFNRNTLFGLMPIWLPVLWGYGFIAIKRTLPFI